MNAWVLLTELKKMLVPHLATLPLPVRGRDRNSQPVADEDGKIIIRPAAVYLGSMPPTPQDALASAPFVVLQIMGGRDDAEGMHNIRVGIRVCIVSEDLEEAENDLHNLISLIRLYILALPQGVLGKGHFRLAPFMDSEGKAPWERPDEQALPFLQAHIFTQWQTPGARKKPSPGMADYE